MAELVELRFKGPPVGACLRGAVFGLVDVAGKVFGDDSEVDFGGREFGENAVCGSQACDAGAEDDDIEFRWHVDCYVCVKFTRAWPGNRLFIRRVYSEVTLNSVSCWYSVASHSISSARTGYSEVSHNLTSDPAGISNAPTSNREVIESKFQSMDRICPILEVVRNLSRTSRCYRCHRIIRSEAGGNTSTRFDWLNSSIQDISMTTYST